MDFEFKDYRRGSRQELTDNELNKRLQRLHTYKLLLIAQQADTQQLIEALGEEKARRMGLMPRIKKGKVDV